MFRLACVLIVSVIGINAERNENITTLEDLSTTGNSARIINGQDAKLGQFPWQVSVNFYLSNSNAPRYCGGSLINEKWVLTAAHCALGAVRFTLKFGGLTLNSVESGRVDVTATRSYVHPKYDDDNLNNDIALIQLDKPVKTGKTISVIRLPKAGERTGVAEKLEVSGWGKTSDASSVSNKLKYVELSTISNPECTRTYGYQVIILSTVCCSGASIKSTCNGDSGGPLIKRTAQGPVQVGVVSFVHNSGCTSGNPSGYVRTESYLDWIYQITGVVGTKNSKVMAATKSHKSESDSKKGSKPESDSKKGSKPESDSMKGGKSDSGSMKQKCKECKKSMHTMHSKHSSDHNHDDEDDDDDYL